MADADRLLGMYLHLARASDLRRQPMVRDKLLVLAAVHAEEMGLEPIAALCRHKILGHNTRHMIRRWPTVATALENEQFQSYLKQLRRRYSNEKIEHMIVSLDIVLGREREAYFSDLEYAAALLDTRIEAIAGVLAAEPTHPAGPRKASAAKRPKPGGSRGKSARQAPPPAPSSPRQAWLLVWGPYAVGLLLLTLGAVLPRVLAL